VLLKDAFRRNSPVSRIDYVPLGDLAHELATDVEHLRPLLEHRYLKLVEPKEYLKDCIVARPLPAAMDWLRTLMAPAHMQPIFTMEMLCDLLHCKPKAVRTLCILHNVPLHQDPALGELMSLRSFHLLYRKLYSYAGPARYDRQALLFLLSVRGMKGHERAPKKLLPYSRRVEAEIQRVAKLPEPKRSFRATALLEAYQDADTIAGCLQKYYAALRENCETVESALADLERRLTGQSSAQLLHGASSSGQTSLDEPTPADERG
jgi:hypothetical protein